MRPRLPGVLRQDQFQHHSGPNLFTKQSLDDRWAKVGKSEIKKQERQKARDEEKN